MKFIRLVLAVLAISTALYSQEFRATISGAVTDTSGAAIAGAKVTITETNTQTKVETVSDSSGNYAVGLLLPGDYEITVRMDGFKEYVRRGVHLGAGDHPIIDTVLTVGDTKTTLEVTADASLLITENASVGQVITTKEVENLPINGRTPMMMAAESATVPARILFLRKRFILSRKRQTPSAFFRQEHLPLRAGSLAGRGCKPRCATDLPPGPAQHSRAWRQSHWS